MLPKGNEGQHNLQALIIWLFDLLLMMMLKQSNEYYSNQSRPGKNNPNQYLLNPVMSTDDKNQKSWILGSFTIMTQLTEVDLGCLLNCANIFFVVVLVRFPGSGCDVL